MDLSPVSLAAGDINGDGKTDLVVVNRGIRSTVLILKGNGDGGFQEGAHYKVGTSPTSVTLGDFNGSTGCELCGR